MNVVCPTCSANYNFDENRIPAEGQKMRCPKCGASFMVTQGGVSPREEEGAVGSAAGGPSKSGLLWGSGADVGEADLPAPVPSQGQAWDKAAPSVGGTSGGMPDLPMPAAPKGSDSDLLAPVGGPRGVGTTGLPAPTSGGGIADLPVPTAGGGGVELPVPKAGAGADLPIVKSNPQNVDLPVPQAHGSGVDLPVPKPGHGGIDFPVPKSNPQSVDLPVPQSTGASGVDLPVPQTFGGGGVDLPQPGGEVDFPVPSAPGAAGGVHLPVPKVEGFRQVDLPTPHEEGGAQTSGLPVVKPGDPQGGQDLPMPHLGGGDLGPGLPIPVSGGEPLSSEHIVVGAGTEEIFGDEFGSEWGELPQEAASGHSLEGQSVGVEEMQAQLSDLPPPELDNSYRDSVPAVVEGFAPSAPQQGMVLDQPPAALPKDKPKKDKKTGSKPSRGLSAGKKALFGSVAALVVVILVVGIGLGFTSFGFFGITLISELFLPGSGDDLLTSDTVTDVRQKLARDTYRDHRDAVSLVERARRDGRQGEGLAAYAIFLYELYAVRYGESKQYSIASERLSSSFDFAEPDTPAMLLAAAARRVKQGDDSTANMLLNRTMAASANNVDAIQLKAEIFLRTKQADHAMKAFNQLAKVEKRSPRSLFGLVRANLATSKNDVASTLIEELLKLNPDHVGAILEKAALSVQQEHPDEALKLLEIVQNEKAQFASPYDRSRGFEIQGEILLKQEKLGDALAAFREASKLNDQSVGAHLGMGEIFQRQGEVTDALTHFKMAQHIDETNLDAILGVSQALISSVGEGDLQKARKNLEKAKIEHPTEPRVHYLLGRSLEELRHTEDAMAEYEKAIELNKSYLDPYLALSDMLIRRERVEKAMEVLAKARRELPNDPRISLSLGRSYLDRGAHPEAEQQFRHALKVSPEFPPALFNLGVVLRRMGRLNDAQATLERLARLDSQYPGLVMEQGMVLERTGQPDRALAIYRAELERDPDNIQMKLRVAAAQVLVGNCDEAMVLLRDVIRQEPGAAEALYYQGRCMLARGQVAESERVLTLSVEAEPENGTYRAYLGWACLETGNLDRASLELQRSVELDATNPVAFWQRGVLFLRSASPHSAVQDLERALELNPEMNVVYHHLALAYDQMNRPNDAIRYFELSIENDENDFDSLYYLAQIIKDQRGAQEGLVLYRRAVETGRRIEPRPQLFYDALFGYGATLYDVNRVDDAQEVLREYLQHAPSTAVDREEAREILQIMGRGRQLEIR